MKKNSTDLKMTGNKTKHSARRGAWSVSVPCARGARPSPLRKESGQLMAPDSVLAALGAAERGFGAVPGDVPLRQPRRHRGPHAGGAGQRGRAQARPRARRAARTPARRAGRGAGHAPGSRGPSATARPPGSAAPARRPHHPRVLRAGLPGPGPSGRLTLLQQMTSSLSGSSSKAQSLARKPGTAPGPGAPGAAGPRGSAGASRILGPRRAAPAGTGRAPPRDAPRGGAGARSGR